MNGPLNVRSPKRLLACITVATYLTACMSWRTERLSPQHGVSSSLPKTIRVTLVDNTILTLYQAQVLADSLVGFTSDVAAQPSRTRLAVPVASVQSVEVEQVNGGRTTLLVVGIVGGIALIAALYVLLLRAFANSVTAY